MTIEFLVPDMSCGHCVKAITNAVQEAAPGTRVQVDLDAHRVCIDGPATVEQARAAIEEAGYTPQDAA